MNGLENASLQLLATLARQGSAKVLGPLYLDVDSDRAIVERALAFRRAQNLVRAPYLESIAQREVEQRLRLDERSAHFVALQGEEIVATLRMTPAPFEISEIIAERTLESKGDFDDYVEVGRLCTDVHLQQKARVARQITLTAILWQIERLSCRGALALCKQDKVKLFRRFGLTLVAERICIPSRGSDYCIIAGSRQDVLDALWAIASATRASDGSSPTAAGLEP